MSSISLKELFQKMRRSEAALSPEEKRREYTFVLLLVVFFAAALFTMRNFIAMNSILIDDVGQNVSQMPRGNKAGESAAKALGAK